MFKSNKKGKSLLNKVDFKNYTIRLIFLTLACFCSALNYNMIFVPNNIVVGGTSGLAIIFKELMGISTTLFIYISMGILIVIGYFILGTKKSINTIIGSIIYLLMVSITEPIALALNITFKSTFILLVVTSLLNGISSGMVYRTGFNTGGSDILATILNKYLKIPLGQANRLINSFIIIGGTIVFGISKTIMALIILIISTKLIDVIMLGLNDSKICYIKSAKWKEIKDYLINNFEIGVTEINSRGGLFIKKDPTLLIIVPFDKYYGLKKIILEKDNKAFMVAHDCYAVSGGYKKKLLPF